MHASSIVFKCTLCTFFLVNVSVTCLVLSGLNPHISKKHSGTCEHGQVFPVLEIHVSAIIAKWTGSEFDVEDP